MNFGDRMHAAVKAVNVPLGMGLDPHLDRLPLSLQSRYSGKRGRAFRDAAARSVLEFNAAAISAAEGRLAFVKPQFAFYEQLGSAGWAALERTCEMARSAGLLVVGDAKRGDISSTGAAYARAILDTEGPLGCDAVTLSPWMGIDTLDPFLPFCRDQGKGIFVLARTTNAHSSLLQSHGSPTAVETLATALSGIGEKMVGDSGFSPIGAVVGASASAEARRLRGWMPHSWFLVPGMGAQGGSAAQAMAGARSDGMGSLVVCSRSLLFPKGRNERFEENPRAFIHAQISSHIARLGASSY